MCMVRCFWSYPFNALVSLNYCGKCCKSLSKTARHWFIYSLVIAFITLVLCSGRRSLHQFDSPEEEALSLIYSYTPVYAANITGYEQIYFFWVCHSYASQQKGWFLPLVCWFGDRFHIAEERLPHQQLLPILLYAVIHIKVLICINKLRFSSFFFCWHFGDEHLCGGTSKWISISQLVDTV